MEEINRQLIEAAARNELVKVIDLVLEEGADVHAEEDAALIQASVNGNKDIATVLLRNGANVHANGDNPIRSAAHNGHTETVRLLLENGADLHAEDDQALREASANGHTETVRLLIENGADVCYFGDHALREAIYEGHRDVAELLLENGAGVRAYALDEPVKVAANRQDKEMVELLCRHGADIHADNDRPFRNAVYSGHKEMAEYLLEKGADIHAFRDQALFGVVVEENMEMAEFLLERGANPDVCDLIVTNQEMRNLLKTYQKPSDISTTSLYRLCNRENWFTNGTCEEYEDLFEMARNHEPLNRISKCILDHSSSEMREKDIFAKVREIDQAYLQASMSTTKMWKVYGAVGQHQVESFNPSKCYDFSEGGNTRIIEVLNSDKTGTNEYSVVKITCNSPEECYEELRGQLTEGIFENSYVGRTEEMSSPVKKTPKKKGLTV